MTPAPDVLFPSSEAEAAAAFGDGDGVTVVGGGTIVVPELTQGRRSAGEGDRPHPCRAVRRHARRLARHGRCDDAGCRADRAPRSGRAVRGQRRGRRDPRAGDGRRQPLRGRRAGCTPRRSPGRVARGRRDGALHRCGRRDRSAAGGLPRRTRRPAAARRLVRRARRRCVRCPRPPAHARLHGARRVGRDGPRTARSAWPPRVRVAPERVSRAPSRPATRGRGNGRARGRPAARRRARIRLVPGADAPGPRSPCPHRAPGDRMNLTVNGTTHDVASAPLASLLDVLREELGVTSPKAGCEQGGCGSCTVLVDGEPRRACLTAVGSVDGSAITTVEGLGTPERLHRCSRRSRTTTPRSAASARRG